MTSDERHSILVVDDDADITNYLEATLRELDFEVTVANSGEEALVKIDHDQFDLIITDLVMPGMSGFQLMLELHSRQVPMPIIVLSGHDSRDMMREAMKHGAYDFLAKPLALEELKITLRNAFNNISAINEKKRAEADLEKLRSFIGAIESRKSQPDPSLPKMFRGWRREEYQAFRSIGREAVMATGDEIVWDSANTAGVVVVLSGRLSVERGGYNIMHLFSGDAWGSAALLNFSIRPVRIVAETETKIIRFPLHESLMFFRQREERLFKLLVINVVYQLGEWLDVAFDRVIKHEVFASTNPTTTGDN